MVFSLPFNVPSTSVSLPLSQTLTDISVSITSAYDPGSTLQILHGASVIMANVLIDTTTVGIYTLPGLSIPMSDLITAVVSGALGTGEASIILETI